VKDCSAIALNFSSRSHSLRPWLPGTSC
jgi:hypothetical protein